jgi:hypothetical protein
MVVAARPKTRTVRAVKVQAPLASQKVVAVAVEIVVANRPVAAGMREVE